ncbi:MAG TPA: CBS domain-containing protein [Pyrinomonadaceae bacterium]|jgi:CBS domain-containing protein|nr:CBS domain-containing protein [Pyrinomonadaceae bacterium]
MLVQEIMTKNPACCPPDAMLQDVARMMIDNDCGCIPIVENTDSKIPVGMLTDRDITTRIVAEGKNPLDLTAADAMSPSVITVTPDTSLEQCCTLMEENQLRRLAVVDAGGACCGIIAQADIATNASKSKTAEVVQEVSRASA